MQTKQEKIRLFCHLYCYLFCYHWHITIHNTMLQPSVTIGHAPLPWSKFFSFSCRFWVKLTWTRMHSSTKRTTRSSIRPGGGVCLSACWDTPWVWAWRASPGCEPGDPPGCGPGDPLGVCLENPPWVWAWRPAPRPDPSTSPLGVGLETCRTCLGDTLKRFSFLRYLFGIFGGYTFYKVIIS